METIKLTYGDEIPENYTGVVEYDDGEKEWLKNGKPHREDGPSWIRNYDNNKFWNLDGKHIWDSTRILDLTNKIILSKTKHPEYPLVQV